MTAREFVDALHRIRADISTARAMWPSQLAEPRLDAALDEVDRMLLAVADGPDLLTDDGRPAWWWHT